MELEVKTNSFLNQSNHKDRINYAEKKKLDKKKQQWEVKMHNAYCPTSISKISNFDTDWIRCAVFLI